MPVAGGDLRQQREHRVAEVAAVRDQRPRLARDQPIRLRVVDLAAGDGADEARSSAGSIWLSAAITQVTSIRSSRARR